MHDHQFKGGIQNGTVATDARARKLDEQCKHQKESVFAELKQQYPNLLCKRNLPKFRFLAAKVLVNLMVVLGSTMVC